MKRLLAVLVIGLLVFNFGLAGCAKKAADDSQPTPAPTETNGNGDEAPEETTE